MTSLGKKVGFFKLGLELSFGFCYSFTNLGLKC